jgi:MurNAc alpha-1-phosphate uridylyltransferase
MGRGMAMEVSYSFDGAGVSGDGRGDPEGVAAVLGAGVFHAVRGLVFDGAVRRRGADVPGESGKEALMTVYRNEGLFDTSNVEFADGRIVTYDKKARTAAMRHIDYGLGVFRASSVRGAGRGRGL